MIGSLRTLLCRISARRTVEPILFCVSVTLLQSFLGIDDEKAKDDAVSEQLNKLYDLIAASTCSHNKGERLPGQGASAAAAVEEVKEAAPKVRTWTCKGCGKVQSKGGHNITKCEVALAKAAAEATEDDEPAEAEPPKRKRRVKVKKPVPKRKVEEVEAEEEAADVPVNKVLTKLTAQMAELREDNYKMQKLLMERLLSKPEPPQPKEKKPSGAVQRYIKNMERKIKELTGKSKDKDKDVADMEVEVKQ